MSADLEQLLQKAAGGNRDALAFLVAWHRYSHLIDDIVDGDATPQHVITVGRWANELYANPFYVEHRASLGPLVQLITAEYQDSVEMEKSEQEWERIEADTIRHTGANMIRVVAYLLGGYQAMMEISRDLRSLCYWGHHDKDGKPV